MLGPRPFVEKADMDPALGAGRGNIGVNCITPLTLLPTPPSPPSPQYPVTNENKYH